MTIGLALLTLLDLVTEQGLAEGRPEVARAIKVVSKKAEKLRAHREQMRQQKAKRLCVCGQHERRGHHFICPECWKEAPLELRTAAVTAVHGLATQRAGIRALVYWAADNAGVQIPPEDFHQHIT